MPQVSTTGFRLRPGESKTFDVPRPWVAARVWARTQCKKENGRFKCLTGDCGQTGVACNGATGVRPATLAEFTLAADSKQDFYDISNVDGSNLPMKLRPIDGNGETCEVLSCSADINKSCPKQLRVIAPTGHVVGCKSPCAAFGGHLNCCEGKHNTLETCPGNKMAYDVFKTKCPQAYYYQYDDKKGLYTCWNNKKGYEITFCP